MAKAKSGNAEEEEANRAIAELQVDKTMNRAALLALAATTKSSVRREC